MKREIRQNCKLKRLQNYIVNHQQQYAVYVAVFILLFIGGIRFGLAATFVISLINVFFIAFFVNFFNRILSKNGFKFKTITYVWIAFLLFVFANLVITIEFVLWKYLFYDEVTRWYQSLRHWFLHVMFKDIFIVFGSFIASLINYSNKQRKEKELLLYEKQVMELRFLKSQINSHFIFNMLNNIYALAYIKSEQAPKAILKLANILRYITDECLSDTIFIEKELKYIDNYIDLILMKTGHTDNITFKYDIDDYSVKIPPMLLQPAIENSFKHSDFETNKDAVICFTLNIKNKILTFTSYNTKKQLIAFCSQEQKGVGLSNIEQRLQLYFRKKYILQTEDKEDTYTLTMEIDLTKMNMK